MVAVTLGTCFGRAVARAMLLACLVFSAGPECRASDDWMDWRVAGPFVCRADFRLGEIDPLLGDLAQLQEDLIRVLGIAEPRERIEIYLFNDHGTYRRYLASYFPQVPYRRALYIKKGGPGVVLAFRSDQLPTDLRHECTHAILHAVLPMVPLWLDEGLAEFFEAAPHERAFGHPHLGKVRWNARFGISPSLEKLEKKGVVGDMGGADYRDAWAWVHFFMYGSSEGHAALVSFLDDIGRGVPPGAISHRLVEQVPDLKKRYIAHFRGWSR